MTNYRTTNFNAVTVKTEQYQWAHGKMPKGYGLWFFEPYGVDGDGFCITASYADAKRAAIKWAKKQGFGTIKVGA